MVTVLAALGLALVAVAFDGARLGRSWADPALWAGLLVIVIPIAFRLVSAAPTRAERLALVLVLGLMLYLVPVLLSPDGFALHDELGHYRSVTDILRTGKLYTPNPVVAAYAYYPGILSLTAALARLSGLGIVPCGLVVVGLGRLLVVGGLFLFVERVMRSSRIAGIAVVLYTANPNFVFFDAQFAYESLALGLAAMSLWMTARVSDRDTGGWTDVGIGVLLVGALVLTHHITSYAVAIAIALWALLSAITRLRSPETRRLAVLAAFALAATGAYAVYAYGATKSDIGGSLTSSIHGLYQVIVGAAGHKAPFTAAHGYTDPPLERTMGVVAVALLLLALPFGLFASWRRRRQGIGVVLLGIAALMYPVTLALRLTAAGTETSNRTSEFVFIGLGAVLALAFVVAAVRWVDGRRVLALLASLLACAYAGIVFVGGITVGTPSYDTLPAGYMVGADLRSVDAEGVAAAKWAGKWLPGNSHFLADETDGELWTAHTGLRPQSGSTHGTAVGQLFLSPAFGAIERRVISADKLDYLVVDKRDSTALPRSGRYFDSGNPLAVYTQPLSLGALTKFDNEPCTDRIFSSGNVVVYDTSRVVAGCH
ncbi:MAG TPA: hypothetical protein VGI87_13000 [Solirubrobacteraceae bacterium]